MEPKDLFDHIEGSTKRERGLAWLLFTDVLLLSYLVTIKMRFVSFAHSLSLNVG
jgi:hypothetical protein